MGQSGVREIRNGESVRERTDREGSPNGRPSRPAPSGAGAERVEPEATDRDKGVRTRRTPPAKRAVDVLFALTGLLLTSPAWVVLPVLIKLEDGGPVFFEQDRVGKGGERFTSWKFRSMSPRPEGRDGPPSQAELEADRVTRVGSFMRPCALDELPQLLNVLKGDMSLVGPRALLPEELEHRSDGDDPVRLEELPGYEERHSVLPGLTGLGQTSTARDRPHRKKFHYDIRYARNRNLLLDLRLIVQSVVISLIGGWSDVERNATSEA